MASVAWTALLEQAAATTPTGKFSDGIEHINRCMGEFEKELASGTDRAGKHLVKEPMKFLKTWMPKLTKEQKTALAHIHEVRGDIMVGLGAHKYALTEYRCSQALGRDDATEKVTQTEDLLKPCKTQGKP